MDDMSLDEFLDEEGRPRSDAASSAHRGDPARDGSGHRGPRRKRRRGPFRRFLPLVLVVGVLGLLGVGGVLAFNWVQNGEVGFEIAQQDEDFEGPGTGSVEFTIMPGDTGTDIGRGLEEAGVVASTGAFVTAFSADPDAASIRPGTYQLKHEMSAVGALEAIEDPANLVANKLVVPEGTRASDIYELISTQLEVPLAEVEAAAEDTQAYGLPAAAEGNPEGYLFPATYSLRSDDTPTDVLTRMVARNEQSRADHGVSEEDWHTVLTKASLVQGEARYAEDFGKVARVIENRLAGAGTENGQPMPLQFDSTISYFTGKSTVATTTEDRQTENPYNTYLNQGLPPTPINNPGDQAVTAALDPTPGPWLFFVTVNTDTGETRFTDSYEEHMANREQWQEWARQQDTEG